MFWSVEGDYFCLLLPSAINGEEAVSGHSFLVTPVSVGTLVLSFHLA